MSKYMQARGTRRDARVVAGRFRAGMLAPVMAVPFRESEGGFLNQAFECELDPVAGRMVVPPSIEVICLFVPTQASDEIRDPDAQYAGSSEVVRDKLLSGQPLFGLEDESVLSKRMGVVPISIGGQLKVSSALRLAHNAGVNFLRLSKYDKARTLRKHNRHMTPAIISRTALERLNGVLNPEDRVNGSVQMRFAENAPVRGIGKANADFHREASGVATREAGGRIVKYGSYRPCCTNRMRDSLLETNMVAGGYEQWGPYEVQDRELVGLQ